MSSTANERQVGGAHYQGKPTQHWDFALQRDLGYLEGQITKYIARWRDKNGLQDLEKDEHYLQKLIENIKLMTLRRTLFHEALSCLRWHQPGVAADLEGRIDECLGITPTLSQYCDQQGFVPGDVEEAVTRLIVDWSETGNANLLLDAQIAIQAAIARERRG